MKREKILIIDDEKDFLDLLESALKRHGYDVIKATDGVEGVEKAKSQKPDMVICDIRMPKKDGYAVLKEIRQDIDKNLPVIILSAIDDFRNIQEAYDYEADFYVSKPVEFVTFLKNVRALLNINRNKRS
ncbi:MAG: response regulator [Candidatus Omnitrophota bacterium]